jgi:hypothetical protein
VSKIIKIANHNDIFVLTGRLKAYFDKGDNQPPIYLEYKTKGDEPKTNPQLNWLHDIIADYLVDVLFEQGCIEAKSPHLAKFWLKEHIGYGDEVRHKIKRVEFIRFIPKSFANASKKQMGEAIEEAIRVCAFNGVIVPEPKRE